MHPYPVLATDERKNTIIENSNLSSVRRFSESFDVSNDDDPELNYSVLRLKSSNKIKSEGYCKARLKYLYFHNRIPVDETHTLRHIFYPNLFYVVNMQNLGS